MYLDDIKTGTVLTTEPVTVTKEQISDFAETYDPFSIHLDEEYAASTRFGAVIAPGVMTFMMLWKKFVELGLFGDELIAGRRTSIEWFAPVYAGDTLNAVITVTDTERRNAHNGCVTLVLDGYNQKGDKVLRGTVESVVAYKK